ncbi:MAG: elongation factor P, partial [Firmicutes bacterium]|nr:elongation factor P [Bacillota bacterium]
MVNVNDFKTGMSIKYEGNIYSVVDYQHVKPGKGAAFVKAKLKNLRTGAIIEITFNSSVKVELAHIEKRDMQFLYSQGDTYYFMNMETYDQIEVKESQLGDDKKYLKENLVLNIISYEGEILG